MAQQIIYASLGGILPALIWLSFWLREDNKHPEPSGLILKTFLFGMLAVVAVIPVQKLVSVWSPGLTFATIIIWVVLEEAFKFVAAYFGGLHSVEDNEPTDPIIYMISAALGFVAIENTLFILGPLVGNQIVDGFITGNLRFIGASLLHVVASGIIGVGLALAFYKSLAFKVTVGVVTFLIAALFHGFFNLSIIHWTNSGTLIAFSAVWLGVIMLLLAFEKAKTVV